MPEKWQGTNILTGGHFVYMTVEKVKVMNTRKFINQTAAQETTKTNKNLKQQAHLPIYQCQV